MIEKLVLFDIDGTLLHGGGSGRTATERAMRELFGTVGKLADYRFDGKTDRYTLIQLLMPEGFTQEYVEARLPEYEVIASRHLTEVIDQHHFRTLPGAIDLVNALKTRSDMLIGLITGNLPQMAAIKLRRAGFDLDDFAVKVYGSEACARRELAPIVIERAQKYCGVPFEPTQVVMLGDTLDDIDCAHNIGARMISVATGPYKRDQLEAHSPYIVFDDLTDNEAVIEAIFR